MSKHRQIYGANTAVLSDFPEPLRETLRLIEKNPSNEAALELIEHSLTSGFTVDEQSALLRFLEPFMDTALRAPRGR